MDIRIAMRLEDKQDTQQACFKPIEMQLVCDKKSISNDISTGQHNLNSQIQNLKGSELAMPYIKDSDGQQQFKALSLLLDKKSLNMVEVGGGRGETNAVPYALQKAGLKVNLLNIELHKDFERPYIDAHNKINISNAHVI